MSFTKSQATTRMMGRFRLGMTILSLAYLLAYCKSAKPSHALSENETLVDDQAALDAALDKGGPYLEYPVIPETHEPVAALAGRDCRTDKSCGFALDTEVSAQVQSGFDRPNQLTLYVTRSPKGMGWASPRNPIVLIDATKSKTPEGGFFY